MSLTRRQFLIESMSALGGCLIGERVARLIIRRAAESASPYVVDVSNPEHTLYANDMGGEFKLTLGCPEAEDVPDHLTWAEWFDWQGVDPGDPGAVEEVLEDFWVEVRRNDKGVIILNLKEAIPDNLMDHYIDGGFVGFSSATAQAYWLLTELGLADTEPTDGESLGRLRLYEGACIGSNSCVAYADDVETLGCVQQRLIQIGKPTEILLC